MNSSDVVGCGGYESPCKTIEYSLMMNYTSNDVIVLDGGRVASFTYIIRKTIHINKNITIKKFEHGRKPVITAKTNDTWAFSFTSNVML